MKVAKRVTRLADIGPLMAVLRMGPEGMKTRLARGMKTICRVCQQPLVEGDSLCAGFPQSGATLILHERCLDEQARSVMK